MDNRFPTISNLYNPSVWGKPSEGNPTQSQVMQPKSLGTQPKPLVMQPKSAYATKTWTCNQNLDMQPKSRMQPKSGYATTIWICNTSESKHKET